MSILSRLALIFVAVPLLELFLLIRLGGAIGLLPTLSLCVLTGVAGAWLARREGLRALWSFQQRLARGGVPGRALMDGLCILLGGALLLTPGLLTDVVGFSLLLPPSRRWIQKRIQRRIERQLADGSLRVTTIGGFPGAGGARSGAGGAHRGAGGAQSGAGGAQPGASGASAGAGGASAGAGGASAGAGGASGWGLGTRRGPFGADAGSDDEAPRSRPGEIIQEKRRNH
ncbi:MAG: FxsA family protein [Gammaproteobacteria bacterium]|nr:FxsA family protein [Gammaproteobacteria bacterium]